jgi:hypothetical protein
MIIDSDLLQRLSDEFSALTDSRHEMGAETYGPVKFLEIDTVQMAAEELADLANYSRYLFIKLRLMEMSLIERGIDLSSGSAEDAGRDDEVPSSPSAFVPSKEVSGFLPFKERP